MRRIALSVPGALLAGTALAGPVDFSVQFQSSRLARSDDLSSGPVSLPFAINYFGNTYSALYINNNGHVTFAIPLRTFTPFLLDPGYIGGPIIAPFFADVDTRNPGSGLTSWGNGTYNGQPAFGVTWPEVGYYVSHADRLNTFQLILTNRADTGAGNFDVYLNYDRIEWETGDANGGRGGLGGISAAAGFNAGAGNKPGTTFQFPGSLVNGALLVGGPDSLVASSNDGVAGQYRFAVRNGTVSVPQSTVGVPEPASFVLLGAGLLGLAGLRQRFERTT